jgi:hypothetical protein
MQSKGFFPKFWRPHDSTDAPDTLASTEAPVNKSQTQPAEGLTGPQTDLLSYEDIYRAARILSPRSGYGIHKVVDMLNSDRIRSLSPDIKRASVLMALDAAGTSAEDLLQDATAASRPSVLMKPDSKNNSKRARRRKTLPKRNPEVSIRK